MYGRLEQRNYRLIKTIFLESNTPSTEINE